MSLPNIPNITPTISVNREQVFNVILASIGLEEIALSHILNAEGEKIQEVISGGHTFEDLVCIDKVVIKVLREVMKKEMLLQFKLEDVLEAIRSEETVAPRKRCDNY